MSWGAVDSSRPDGQSDELIGFVIACVVLAKESEVGPLLPFIYALINGDASFMWIMARSSY